MEKTLVSKQFAGLEALKSKVETLERKAPPSKEQSLPRTPEFSIKKTEEILRRVAGDNFSLVWQQKVKDTKFSLYGYLVFGEIFIAQIFNDGSAYHFLSTQGVSISFDYVGITPKRLEILESMELIERNKGRYVLTEKGRKELESK